MSIAPTKAVSSDHLRRLQQRRKQVLVVGIAFGVALLTLVDSSWRSDWPRTHRSIQGTGLMLILVCIFGRTWCALYIGGMKRRELVTKGPYSVVRNPLYLFTMFGAAGIGALSGSVTLAVLCTGFAAAVFASVVRREEAFLLATFPHEYPAYAARVRRLIPRFSTWQDAALLVVNPRMVHRTFLDASLFLMAVPLIGLKALVAEVFWLPILIYLP
jgi:protein-S-isoprenylcysteine O-methyltransferase Ste14